MALSIGFGSSILDSNCSNNSDKWICIGKGIKYTVNDWRRNTVRNLDDDDYKIINLQNGEIVNNGKNGLIGSDYYFNNQKNNRVKFSSTSSTCIAGMVFDSEPENLSMDNSYRHIFRVESINNGTSLKVKLIYGSGGTYGGVIYGGDEWLKDLYIKLPCNVSTFWETMDGYNNGCYIVDDSCIVSDSDGINYDYNSNLNCKIRAKQNMRVSTTDRFNLDSGDSLNINLSNGFPIPGKQFSGNTGPNNEIVRRGNIISFNTNSETDKTGGFKICGQSDYIEDYYINSGRQIFMQDLLDSNGNFLEFNGVDVCKYECNNRDRCKGFNLNTSTDTCWLQQSNGLSYLRGWSNGDFYSRLSNTDTSQSTSQATFPPTSQATLSPTSQSPSPQTTQSTSLQTTQSESGSSEMADLIGVLLGLI